MDKTQEIEQYVSNMTGKRNMVKYSGQPVFIGTEFVNADMLPERLEELGKVGWLPEDLNIIEAIPYAPPRFAIADWCDDLLDLEDNPDNKLIDEEINAIIYSHVGTYFETGMKFIEYDEEFYKSHKQKEEAKRKDELTVLG